MKTKSQKPKWREGAIEEFNAAIEATNHAEKVSSIAQVKAVFGQHSSHTNRGMFPASLLWSAPDSHIARVQR